jgi:hypothetical protein
MTERDARWAIVARPAIAVFSALCRFCAAQMAPASASRLRVNWSVSLGAPADGDCPCGRACVAVS